MEKIFKKYCRESFAKELSGYFSEAEEAYEGLFFLNYKTRAIGNRLLMYLFGFTKELEKSNWSTMTMLRYLNRIAETGEVLFLPRDNEYESCDLFKDHFEHDNYINTVLMTGATLYYYYRLYEQPFHSEKYNTRTAALWDRLRSYPERKSQKNANKTSKNLPLLIKKGLDERVFGQEEAKKTLSMAVAAFIMKGIRVPVMLAGGTGCGKTHLIQSLSEIAEIKDDIYVHFYNSTELTKTGFTGDDLKDVLKRFRKRLDGKHGILVFDEMDKLLAYRSCDHEGNDVNETIVHDLLTAISGNDSDYCVDTNKVLFIFLGAFENLENSRNEEKKKIFGFQEQVSEEADYYDLRQELIKIGCSRQFIGRVGKIVMMEPLDKASIRRIFVDKKYGVLEKKKEEFSLWDLNLEWDEGYLDAAVEEVMASGQGARYITSLVERTIGTADYDLMEQGKDTMTLNKEMLSNNHKIFC